jgi:hypothetical protein
VGVLFRGYGATLAREIPGTSIWIGVYEALVQQAAARGRPREELTNMEIIGFGSIAGMLYWAIPFPVDTVKTSMQAGVTPANGAVPGFLDTARALYARGGIGAFYRGLAPSIVRAAPASAAILFCSESIQRSLDEVFPPNATTVEAWQGDDSRIRSNNDTDSRAGTRSAATGSSSAHHSPDHSNSMAAVEPSVAAMYALLQATVNLSSVWSLWSAERPRRGKQADDDESQSPWRGAR